MLAHSLELRNWYKMILPELIFFRLPEDLQDMMKALHLSRGTVVMQILNLFRVNRCDKTRMHFSKI